MKVWLYGYDVEIRATNPVFHNEYNEQDTMAVLNFLAMDKYDLCKRLKNEKGAGELAKIHRKDLEDFAKVLGKDCFLSKELGRGAGMKRTEYLVSNATNPRSERCFRSINEVASFIGFCRSVVQRRIEL